MFGKFFKFLLPLAKKVVEKEIEKKTGLPIKVDGVIKTAGKIL